ncbi:flagellar basal body P-ring protein FlgI [Aquisalinus flavus]|uniref:Flagellar P-ring protein n=1 Tax=Aquisalinus flavus TaxID=1526572 RepID=A0A8J2V1U4_9PROT|nr:flagellar basal body P-ring protein FlgI [Aquisalinus flavus]GGD12432.1 flagellar P-ring protein [Aquisalinus flavus]
MSTTMMKRTAAAFALAIGSCLAALSPASADVRLKDLVDVEGVRGNDLVGYGLVIGLNGTGDTLRNSPYTEEALANILERLGVNVQGEDFRPNNVAAVLVTAELPPFSRRGSRIDVTVSSIGDAKSLSGGTLVMTPLNAADNQIYAVAQGSVLVSGFKAEGDAQSVVEGVPTAGTIPGGAFVEKEIDFTFAQMPRVRLALRDPDFTTAERVETAINQSTGTPIARMMDAGTVELSLADGIDPARLMSRIENITLQPAQKARVVIDQRSGTIVLGADVTVSTVAVSQGNLSIRITETPVVSQPNPFSRNGETIVVPRTTVDVFETGPGNIATVQQNVTLSDLVSGLNALGVSPREMIDILKTMKTAGALHAELVLQ